MEINSSACRSLSDMIGEDLKKAFQGAEKTVKSANKS